jgi:hypothetical protein
MSQGLTTCSFLTFNVFSDVPAFRHLDRRLEIAADAIASHRPSVVALQEIVRASACGDIGRSYAILSIVDANEPNTICITPKLTAWAKTNGNSRREWLY